MRKIREGGCIRPFRKQCRLAEEVWIIYIVWRQDQYQSHVPEHREKYEMGIDDEGRRPGDLKSEMLQKDEEVELLQ